MKLQNYIDQLVAWAMEWSIKFQPIKCNIMQLTRKRYQKSMLSTIFQNDGKIKYLGVTIIENLRWSSHGSKYLHEG